MGKRRLTLIPLFLLITLSLNLSGCKEEQKSQAPPPPRVTVSNPLVRNVVEWDEYVGRLEATDKVEVMARVSGYLESIHFKEGEVVDKGQLLFVIDPRPFEAALNRTRGELDLAKARRKLAENNLARAKKLLDSRAISQEEYDTRESELEQAKATVQSMEAALEEAKLDLEFTRIKATISGRISSELVTEGNLINGGTDGTMLTSIVSLDPIYCYFEIDERSFLEYMNMFQSGIRPDSSENPASVYIGLSDEKGFPHKGKMDFLDNSLDPETGTMTGRAIFTNPDHKLTPGMFARVLLQGSKSYEAIQIPEESIGTDQSQKFVYVVNSENIVKYIPVVLGPVIDGLRVIREGLEPDDRVIVSGLQRVRPDSKVDPVMKDIKVQKDSANSYPDVSDSVQSRSEEEE